MLQGAFLGVQAPQSTPAPAVMGDEETMVDKGRRRVVGKSDLSADLPDRTAGQRGQPPNAACGSW